MPFYNLTAGETRAVCDFTERRAARTRTRMTFMGGQSTTIETQRDDGAESATPYLDCIVGVVEAVQRRYALTCLAADSTDPPQQQQQQSSSSPLSPASASVVPPEEATTTGSGERPYPFPSLFLHTPHQLVALQGAREPASTPSTSPLADVHCTPLLPPVALLCTDAGDAALDSSPAGGVHERKMVAAPLPYETADAFPVELRRHAAPVRMNASLTFARHMVNLSLTPSKPVDNGEPSSPSSSTLRAPVQQMVQVVQQAEVALVVSSPPRTEAAHKTDAAVAMSPFLLSPDATSCVLVACRVTLHPSLQRAVVAVEACATARAALDGEVHLCLPLLQAAVTCAAASMAHLDRPAGVHAVLHEMVWESAVPAFLHALHHHASSLIPHATPPLPAAAAVSLLEATAEAVWRLYHSLPHVHTRQQQQQQHEAEQPPLLHVDWYVVGGIRMKACAAPVLAEIFRTFFSPAAPSELLRAEVPLSMILAPASTSTRTASHSSEGAIQLVLRVAHRLREDGQCFWSFNTTFQPWAVDPKPTQRYAYPVTWGLLLSVATGYSWPATVQPGTRMGPLSEVRGMMSDGGYHWISPLEHTSSATADDAASGCDDRSGLRVACNAVPSPIVARRVNALAAKLPPALRLWSTFTSSQNSSSSSSSSSSRGSSGGGGDGTLTTARLTLANYVRTMLERQDAWWQSWLSGSSSPSVPRRVLPLLLSRCRQGGGVVDWDVLSMDVVEQVLAQPLVRLLNGSTTPHCEPPEFCAQSRNQLLWRASVSAADVFEESTDGLYID